jgi:hypothetical protein
MTIGILNRVTNRNDFVDIVESSNFTIRINANGLHMACGGFEALSFPPKPKLATE